MKLNENSEYFVTKLNANSELKNHLQFVLK